MTDQYDVGALIVTRRPAKEMADGTLRVQIDVEPADRRKFLDLFPDNGDPIAVAMLDPDSVRAHQQEKAFATADPQVPKGNHGKFAQYLVQSGFFRRPDVWRAAGSDADFLAWTRQQQCNVHSQWCAGDVVAAHVRRVANGSGTGTKPEYSAIPLCDHHHREQHDKGEQAIGGKGMVDRDRIRHLERWSRDAIKAQIGRESFAAVSPDELLAWCEKAGIEPRVNAGEFA